MKSKPFLVLIVVLILFPGLAYLSSALSSEVTTCVQCHTSDRIMKDLYKPPKIDTSEGEG